MRSASMKRKPTMSVLLSSVISHGLFCLMSRDAEEPERYIICMGSCCNARNNQRHLSVPGTRFYCFYRYLYLAVVVEGIGGQGDS